jgi:hypothetical protein
LLHRFTVQVVVGREAHPLQRRLELMDHRGALLDELDLVAAQQPQLGRERVLGQQRPPAVAVGAQRVGEAPLAAPDVFIARSMSR